MHDNSSNFTKQQRTNNVSKQTAQIAYPEPARSKIHAHDESES